MVESSERNLPLLDLIREFTRAIRSEVYVDPDLSQTQKAKMSFRLGQLSTFRAIHILLGRNPECYRSVHDSECLPVLSAYVRLFAKAWFEPPAMRDDFTTHLIYADAPGRKKQILCRGGTTGFFIRGVDRLSALSDNLKPPLSLGYECGDNSVFSLCREFDDEGEVLDYAVDVLIPEMLKPQFEQRPRLVSA